VPVLKSFAGGGVFGAAWGSSPAEVLALPGWRHTHDDFAPMFDVPEFADLHGAIALDLFGFGATPAPPEAWGSAGYAEHLVPLFTETDLGERVTVVGHSFGGKVAVRLARLVPDRIDRLVLTGVPLLHRQGRRASPPLGYRVGRRLHRLGLVGDDRMEAMRRRHGSADYRAAQGVMRDVLVTTLAEQYADDMAAVDCPVDLVWGELDTDVPLEVAERARLLFPQATLRVLPGIGHLTPTEAPDLLRQAILDGLTTSSGGPA
jgi:pimeloyl-ACP methyl ester carboxylesterase